MATQQVADVNLIKQQREEYIRQQLEIQRKQEEMTKLRQRMNADKTSGLSQQPDMMMPPMMSEILKEEPSPQTTKMHASDIERNRQIQEHIKLMQATQFQGSEAPEPSYSGINPNLDDILKRSLGSRDGDVVSVISKTSKKSTRSKTNRRKIGPVIRVNA